MLYGFVILSTDSPLVLVYLRTPNLPLSPIVFQFCDCSAYVVLLTFLRLYQINQTFLALKPFSAFQTELYFHPYFENVLRHDISLKNLFFFKFPHQPNPDCSIARFFFLPMVYSLSSQNISIIRNSEWIQQPFRTSVIINYANVGVRTFVCLFC